MDTFLAIASRREVRDYTDQPIPDEIVHRILDAGRLAGSSRNSQQWEFVIVRDREALAQTRLRAGQCRSARRSSSRSPASAFPFDKGRAAQNMMLAAWNDGVGSCPNGISDAEAAERIVGAPVGDRAHRSAIRRSRATRTRAPPKSGRRARSASRSTEVVREV